MLQYRIYTERKKLRWMCEMISDYFGGFTMYKTLGYWDAKAERSVCIEIITDKSLAEFYLNQIRLKIMGVNQQESVLITKSEVEVIWTI